MSTTQDAPNYDVEIDADELLADLAVQAAAYAEQVEKYGRWWRESLEYGSEHTEARVWLLESKAGLRAYSEVLATLQPESARRKRFRNEDGTVDVRGLMKWVSQLADEAHERRHEHTKHERSVQASEAESAYTRILSTLRDEYGIGWPRLDDLGGNPLEEDLP